MIVFPFSHIPGSMLWLTGASFPVTLLPTLPSQPWESPSPDGRRSRLFPLSISYPGDWKPGNTIPRLHCCQVSDMILTDPPVTQDWQTEGILGLYLLQQKLPKAAGMRLYRRILKEVEWLVDDRNGPLLLCSDLWAKLGLIRVNIALSQ